MRRSSRFAVSPLLVLCLGLSACLSAPSEGGQESAAADEPSPSTAPANAESAEEDEEDALLDERLLPSELASPRGFGTMTGRLPGTNTTVSGVRLRGHEVRVTIRDGFAHTEIEEEFANDTDRVLEGRYVFPMPADASLSRLALWVNEDLVEGEMVERERAARIFQGIVDDTVRPRDPALLEWTRGSSFSLKIFPMPAHGSRRVLLAYDEVLPVVEGRARYVYPLSLGADRAVQMDAFRLHVVVEDVGAPGTEARVSGHTATLRTENGRLEADFAASAFVPKGDFVLDYPRPSAEALPVSVEGEGSPTNPGFFSVRIPVSASMSAPLRSRDERVIVIDKSHGMTKQGLDAEIAVADTILRKLRPEERFAVLLCDTSCSSYPIRGLSMASPASIAEARDWMRNASVRGASDLAGALVEATARLSEKGHGQIVYFGDGAPTAGELKVDTIAARARPKLEEKGAELRFFGAGPSVDELVLEGLSSALSASYERMATGDSLARRAQAIAKSLAMPMLTDVKLELPQGFVEAYPRTLPAVRIGEEILVVGRLSGATGALGSSIKLSGSVDGEPMEISHSIAFQASPTADRQMLARRWASARIAELGRSSSDAAAKETIALSTRYHVQSRLTSLLVLENDSMFAAFGIPRTQGRGKLSTGVETAGSNVLPSQTDSIGDGFGAGGLGLSGIGEGGGGIGTGQGFGSGHGRLSGSATGAALGGSHKTSSPRVRMGSTTVSGRLPPEVIQRIVRQNFGRFRLCYENGLRNNPNLQGRVGVRFIITRDGSIGSVANAGSNLPDAGVVSCVIRGFQGLRFPQPEGGIVTVTYPVLFGPAEPSSWPGGYSHGFRPPIESWIGKANEDWRKDAGDSLARLVKDVSASPESRRAREALVSALLLRGRFDEALREANQYLELDPDRAKAHELVAQSAAALGQEELATATLDSEIELDPLSVELHKRAARAFEAVRDERRACAHFRTLAEIRPNDVDFRADALWCKAFVDSEREAVLTEIIAIKEPSKKIEALRIALEKNEGLPYWFGEPSGERISVKISCGEGVEGCPRVVLLDPQGRVSTPMMPSTSRSGATWVTASWASGGNYRVLVTGGLPGVRGEVTVRLDDTVRKFDAFGGEGARTVAVISVSSW